MVSKRDGPILWGMCSLLVGSVSSGAAFELISSTTRAGPPAAGEGKGIQLSHLVGRTCSRGVD